MIDIRVPFWSLVWLMVKGAIALIPAAIILGLIALAANAALAGLGLGLLKR